MNELLINDPCVVFALARESAPFRKEFPVQQGFPGCPVWGRFCGPAWLTTFVMHSGIGHQRMGRTLDWLLGRPVLGNLPYRPRVVISAGFAGALRTTFHVGDVLLATEVVDSKGNIWPTTWPEPFPAGPWQPPIHRGRLLTSRQLVGKPEDKQALAGQFDAVAVDMESAVLAERCSKEAIPFGCLRVISDDAKTSLSPQLVRLLSGGNVSPWRAALALLCRPTLAGEFWRLSQQTKFAAEQLGKALGEVLTLSLSWSDELEKR